MGNTIKVIRRGHRTENTLPLPVTALRMLTGIPTQISGLLKRRPNQHRDNLQTGRTSTEIPNGVRMAKASRICGPFLRNGMPTTSHTSQLYLPMEESQRF